MRLQEKHRSLSLEIAALDAQLCAKESLAKQIGLVPFILGALSAGAALTAAHLLYAL